MRIRILVTLLLACGGAGVGPSLARKVYTGERFETPMDMFGSDSGG